MAAVPLELVADAGAVLTRLACDAADGASLVPHSSAMQSFSCGLTMLVVAHSFQLATFDIDNQHRSLQECATPAFSGPSCCTQNANPPS